MLWSGSDRTTGHLPAIVFVGIWGETKKGGV